MSLPNPPTLPTMTIPWIERRSLLARIAGISGPAVVIDTFRAFTTAAFLFDRGVERIVLAETPEEARTVASRIPGALLAGEDGGRRPDGFDIGNSPGEVMRLRHLPGNVVMRTSAGTRAVITALREGADPVYAAALVVAEATVTALRGRPRVTIVAAGESGITRAVEDEETADLIADRLLGSPHDPNRLHRMASGAGGLRLRASPWVDPRDLGHCLERDRFSFAMRARIEDGLANLHREESVVIGSCVTAAATCPDGLKTTAAGADTTRCVGERSATKGRRGPISCVIGK